MEELENPLTKCRRPTKLDRSEPCGVTHRFKNEDRTFISQFPIALSSYASIAFG
jgi:hypothetical protein